MDTGGPYNLSSKLGHLRGQKRVLLIFLPQKEAQTKIFQSKAGPVVTPIKQWWQRSACPARAWRRGAAGRERKTEKFWFRSVLLGFFKAHACVARHIGLPLMLFKC